MERHRLKNIALRKVKQEQPKPTIQPCAKCGNEAFLFDFRRPVTVKTCKNETCKDVQVVDCV